MGITQVGSGETEGFEEGIDLEYHNAAEDPNVLEPEENTREAVLSHGGCGSSSLRECIELLNNQQRKSPATCHSGPKMENRSGPPQKTIKTMVLGTRSQEKRGHASFSIFLFVFFDRFRASLVSTLLEVLCPSPS